MAKLLRVVIKWTKDSKWVVLLDIEGMEIEVGMQFRATTDDGDQSVMIIDIQDEEVIVDGHDWLVLRSILM